MKLLTIFLAIAALFLFNEELRSQAVNDFFGENALVLATAPPNIVKCVDLEDDTFSPSACLVAKPGVEGTFKIIEWYNVTDFGTMDATTKTWDTDIALETGASWFTHDTEDANAILTSTPIEGNGQFENKVTLFYKGYSAARRNFFQKAHETSTKFAVGVTDENGNVHVLQKCSLLPTFDTKTSEDTSAAGWSVELTMKGDLPMAYTAAFL